MHNEYITANLLAGTFEVNVAKINLQPRRLQLIRYISRLKNNIAILVSKKIKREKMAWIYLFIAGLFEIGWAIGLKYTDGFTKLWPSVITVIIMILSFYFLSSAIKTIPIGTGYAIWTGIGAVGTAILGIFLFGESKEFIRLFFILLIIIGIVGLKIFSKVPAH